VKFRALGVGGAFEVTPAVHPDNRGVFLEWFRSDAFIDAVGHPLALAQANCSVSRRGTLRGIHFTVAPPGQAKYVTCLHGAVFDVVLDVRDGSPTFGEWSSVLLDDCDHRGVYLAEGLGHAFLALTDAATVAYLCSAPYAPDRDRSVRPLDPDLAIAWPADVEPLLSPKDAAAPTLREAQAKGLLPSYDDCREYYTELCNLGNA